MYGDQSFLQKNYLVKKRRKLFFVIGILIIIFIIVFFSLTGSRSKLEKKYIGKILRIEGSVNDYGLVQDYKKDRYIVLVHFYKQNQPTVVHKLRGNYSFNILAENMDAYRAQRKIGESQSIKKGEQKEIPQEDNQTDIMVLDKNSDITENSDQPVSEEKELIDQSTENETPVFKEKNDGPSWGSELDKKRVAGLNFLENVVKDCSQKSEILQEKQVSYDNECIGFTYDTYGNQINRSLTPVCRLLLSEINNIKENIRLNMVNALSFARKQGVYPGQIRETCEKYGFNKDDWE